MRTEESPRQAVPGALGRSDGSPATSSGNSTRRKAPIVARADDTVTVPRAEFHAALVKAEWWDRLWASPYVCEFIADYFEWESRRDLSGSTAVMAGMVDWRAVASAPSYAELERRRAQPSWVPACLHRDTITGHVCGRVLPSIPHRPTGRETCQQHAAHQVRRAA